MSAPRILVVEDNADVSDMLRVLLGAEGYDVIAAYDGGEALAVLKTTEVNLVVLDLMLPVVDGLEVLRRTRLRSTVPIIILTAKVGEAARVTGLNLGADDYLEKPFSPTELVARIQAQLRRAGASMALPTVGRLELGGLVLQHDGLGATVDGREVALTQIEYELLHVMGSRVGRVLSREQLLDLVWPDSLAVQPRSVDVHIRRLRLKIERDPQRPRRLLTVHGVGYKLVAV